MLLGLVGGTKSDVLAWSRDGLEEPGETGLEVVLWMPFIIDEAMMEANSASESTSSPRLSPRSLLRGG